MSCLDKGTNCIINNLRDIFPRVVPVFATVEGPESEACGRVWRFGFAAWPGVLWTAGPSLPGPGGLSPMAFPRDNHSMPAQPSLKAVRVSRQTRLTAVIVA